MSLIVSTMKMRQENVRIERAMKEELEEYKKERR
jgi:hypothetical protein